MFVIDRPDLERLRTVGDGLADLVAVLDPDSVPLPEAPRWWEALDRIERLAAAAKTLLARRVEESGAWERSGCRSAAEHLARISGTGVGRARDQLAASNALPGLPGTDPRYLALLRIDLDALTRGAAEGDETCEITGIGPIPVRVARELLGESIIKLVVTRGVDVANVTHLGRGPTAAQRIALLWQSPACSVEGCARTRVEIDHREPWAATHRTRLDRLDPLCAHHHDQKHRRGWALTPGTGRRPFVAPHDPRHPCNTDRADAPPRAPP